MATFPAGTFTNPNRIALKTRGRREEGAVSVAQCYPGYLVMNDGAGGIKPHNVYGKLAEIWIVEEQGLQGIGGATTPKGAFDAYAIGDQAQYLVAAKGDLVQVLLRNGDTVAINDLLVSNGDGTLAKLPSSANNGGNLYEIAAASSEITNTTVETAFSNGSYNIPANFLQAGDILRVRAQGIADNQNSTDTLNVKLYLGGLAGTNIAATGAVDVATNDEFLVDAYIELRTIGATGTFIANGYTALGTPGTVTAKPFLKGSTSIDTTAAQAIALSATWSAASASDSVRLDYMTVDLIRQSGLITPLFSVDVALDNSGGGSGFPFSPLALVQARVIR